MTAFKCDNCADEWWVCENHPQNPWRGGDADCCGGAGMPCQECNSSTGRDDPPRMMPGSIETWRLQ